ncbi:Dynein beta chain, ciliary-like 1 [Homarus americanus]|uniref:Dynein beta chain, ciliary-like 1 n=1 Tax=Homarus americanus TaxID=6706 RepID=A0A8J5TKL8_HOMAM|nr:Dynein beta chain, ciliary-like 1 [Homarus americanus]
MLGCVGGVGGFGPASSQPSSAAPPSTGSTSPQEALVSVSETFLGNIVYLPWQPTTHNVVVSLYQTSKQNRLVTREKGGLRESVSKFMSHVHGSVNDMSRLYLTNDRRYNYTTPKPSSASFRSTPTCFVPKHNDLQAKIERLRMVDALKAKLANAGGGVAEEERRGRQAHPY